VDSNSFPNGSALNVLPPGAYRSGLQIIISNCTIVNNAGLALSAVGGSLVSNSILWGNGLDYNNASITYSCFKDAVGGTFAHNINSFPYLKTDGSFGLESYSPCIDSGNPFTFVSSGQMDILGNSRKVGVAVDMGAVEAGQKSSTSSGGLPIDWLSHYSLTGNDALPGADPDSDGLSNSEEYQRGSDPTIGNPVSDVYVDMRSTAQSETGLIAAPFKTIQQAVGASKGGETIRVAQGTYSESILVSGKSLNILGGYQGWDAGSGTEVFLDGDRNYTTIIDGSGSTGKSTCSFYCSPSSSVDRFTIQGGSGTKGGAICCIGSSVSITNNIILSNCGTLGGGIYIEGFGLVYPEVIRNVIHDNSASAGGGIYATGTTIRIYNNTLYSNTAVFKGGAIYCSNCSPSICNNLIGRSSLTGSPNLENTAEMGAGIYLFMCSGGTDGNFIGTNAVNAGAAWGGNVIAGNIAAAGGGGMCIDCCTNIQVKSCVISDNDASQGAGILILSSQGTEIKNDTVSNNTSR